MPNLYVDLGYQANGWDQLRSYVKTSGGPNGYWASNDATGAVIGYGSQYYWYFINNNYYSNQVEVQANGSLITPVIPSGTRQATGLNLSYQLWGYEDETGFHQPQVFGGTGIKGLQIVAMASNVSGFGVPQKYSDAGYSAAIQYQSYVSNNGSTSFDLKQNSAWTTVDASNIWIQTAAYDPNTNASNGYNLIQHYPGATLQARVTTDSVLGQSALQVRYGIQSGGSFTESALTGAEWAAIFERFKLVDTNESTPHQADYAFKIQITDGSMTEPTINAAQWVGSAGVATNADTTYVSYDSLAPTPSALYAAGNAIVLAMNGTGKSSIANNVAEAEWQPVSDEALIHTFTLTYQLSGAIPVTVDITSVKSGYAAYLLETASLIPANATVSLTYTPPAGTIGIDQISGVIQDGAMNDARDFTLSATAGAPTGVTFDASSFTAAMPVDNLEGLDFDTANTFKVTVGTGGTFVVDATWSDHTAKITASLKPGQTITNQTFTSSLAWRTWIDANFEKFDSIDKLQFAAGSITATQTMSKWAGRVMADDTIDGGEFAWSDVLKGGAGNDWLSGLSGDDTISGNAGADYLEGGSGNDVLDGGSGNDVLYGGTGNDTFVASASNGYDTLDGGDGFDVADYSALTASINVDLTRPIETGQVTKPGGLIDQLISIEKIIGSSAADILKGDDGDNVFDGRGGADTMIGGLGNDLYYVDSSAEANLIQEQTGDFGQEIVNMGGGNDHIIASSSITLTTESGIEDIYAAGVFTGAATDATINLKGNNQGQGLIGNEAANTLAGGSGNDGLFGNGGNDSLLGGAGDDWLVGGLGNDVMNGEDGDDVIFGFVNGPVIGHNNFKDEVYDFFATGGVDTIDGGNGSDTLVLDGSQFDYSFGLSNGWYVALHAQTGTKFQFRNIEYLSFGATGRNSGNDSLDQTSPTLVRVDSLTIHNSVIGTANADVLSGTESIDMLDGLAGNDTLTGLGGQDLISGGDGNDVIDGGTGMDTMSGGAGDDVFILHSNDADSIDGGAGSDTIKLANDYGIAGGSTIDLNMSTNWLNVENITADSGLLQGNTLLGNSGANVLTGGGGDDALWGREGNDTLDGGAGTDTVWYSGSRSDYTVTVASGVITVKDNRTLAVAPTNDGTDTIKVGVETIRFMGSPESFIDAAMTSAKNTVITALTGTNANDSLTGTASIDAIYGVDGDDTISGLAGDDALYGEGGQDQLDGGAGNDLLSGGSGDDILLNVEAGDTVFGGDGFDVVTTAQTTFSLVDSAKVGGIEGVISTATAAATLTGNAGENLIYGGAGNDTITAGLGSDTVYGGAGVDTVVIGAASSTLSGVSSMGMSLPGNVSNVMSQLGLNSYQSGIQIMTTDGNDQIASDVEYVKFSDGKVLSVGASINAGQAVFVTSGTANTDVLSGTEAIDMLDGLAGNDTLTGLGGQDLISGGDGNDVIDGGTGMDTMSGGAGDDVFILHSNDADSIDGGAGSDTIKLANDYGIAGGSTIDLNMSTNWLNVENITADSGLLQGNTLLGNSGANVLTGGGGDDALWGREGNDTLDGGAGTDTVWYSGSRSDYTVTVASGVITVKDNRTLAVAPTNDGTDTIKVGVETIRFMGSPESFIDAAMTSAKNTVITALTGTNANDSLTGTASIDAIYGVDGDDTISGLAGDDALYGEGGQDQLDGGAGNDLLSGGSGDDILLNVEAGDTVFGGDGFDVVTTAQTTFSLVDSAKVGGIEGVISTATAAATLTGNAGENLIYGGAGNDTITAGLGSDTVYGGAGVDTVVIGAASSTLSGVSSMGMSLPGNVSNVMSQLGLNSYQSGIQIMTTDGNDQIASDVEYVKFSDGKVLSVGASINAGQAVFVTSGTANTDVLSGTEAIDMLDGLAGNDTLTGLGGQDLISGGDGNDVIDGGTGMDTMSGGAGDDVFILHSNDADSIDGGAGSDTIKLANDYGIAGGSTIDLNMSTNWLNVENITADSGLLQGNTLLGNSGANVLTGGGGDDALWGREGNDTLDGGAGTDTVWYSGSRSDYTVTVASGVITVKDNRTLAVAPTNDGTDTIKVGVETIRFMGSPESFIDAAMTSAKNTVVTATVGTGSPDELVGTANTDAIYAGYGDDTLTGLSGDDALYGEDGSDTLDGGAGNDLLSGDFGDDVFLNVEAGDTVFGGDGFDVVTTAQTTFSLVDSAKVSGIEGVISTATAAATLTGNAADNLIYGGTGNDTLDGGVGDDSMYGGAGNDTYKVDSSADFIEEFANEGTDTVVWAMAAGGEPSYVLPENFENLTAMSAGVVVGNSANNVITGSAFGNTFILDGGMNSVAGDDTLKGGVGNDTYIIDMSAQGNVTINDAGGNDTIQFVNDSDGYTTVVTDTTAKTVTITSYADQSQKQALKTITIQNATGTNAGNVEVFNNVWGHNLKVGTDPSANYGEGIDGTLLLGSSANDTYTAGDGNDVFIGALGNDTFYAGTGLDAFDGGLGADYLSYWPLNSTLDPNGTSRTNGVFVWGIFDHSTPENTNQIYLVYKGTTDGVDVQSGEVNFDQIPGYQSWNNIDGLPPGTDALVSIEAVRGTNFSDTMIGSVAGDFFAGVDGNDYINGGNGFDWADYFGASAGVTVNLGVGSVQGGQLLANNGDLLGADVLSGLVGASKMQPYFTDEGDIFGTASGAAGYDILVGVEGIRGSDHADTLIGSSAGNFLRGGLGNDVLIGGASGLPGWMSAYSTDWADYWQAAGSVTVNLGAGTATGADGSDTLSSINGVRGGASDDILIGGSSASTAEWFAGGAGKDTIVGGDGTDSVSYKYATGGVSVTLGTGTAASNAVVAGVSVAGMSMGTAAGADGADVLYGIESIAGSRYDDTLIGDSGDNFFRPLDGQDTIDGGAGSDTIDYREALGVANRVPDGLETFTGGYQAGDLVSATGVVVNLSGPKDVNGFISVRVADGIETSISASVDKIKNIENIVGSVYDDILVGDIGANTLSGMAGADTFIGNGGSDTVSYQRAFGGVYVSMSAGADASAQISTEVATALGVDVSGLTYGVTNGSDGNDLLIGISNIRGSEFDDTIMGNEQDNVIDGGFGDDTLSGGAGDDTLSYRSATGAVSVNLETNSAWGAAGSDQISDFEYVIGSNYGNTMIAATSGSRMQGGAGNDTFEGGAGDDVFRGVSGLDTYTGGAGNDTVEFKGSFTDYTLSFVSSGANAQGMITVTSKAGAVEVARINGDVEFIKFDGNPGMVIDTTLSLSKSSAIFVGEGGQPGQVTPIDAQSIGGTAANDFLVGSSMTGQTISGDAGDDVLDGGTGRDTLIGGVGDDTYVVHKGDKIVELSNQGVDKVVADTSFVLGANLENLTLQSSSTAPIVGKLGLGNEANNTIVGAANVQNKLYGRGGNDTITGGNSWDLISGGSGNDLIYGSSNWIMQNGRVTFTSTELIGDMLLGGVGDDTIYGDNGSDLLDGGVGKDSLYGGKGDDTYNITDKNAVVFEYADEGDDMVVSSLATYTLGENLERLHIASGVQGNGVGNTLNNRIAGNFYDNTLDGGSGNDAIAGDGPTWDVGTSFDPNEQGGNDLLIGGDGQDSLAGQFGDDILIGARLVTDAKNVPIKDKTGNYAIAADADSTVIDYMFGGAGNDIYYISSTRDVAWDVDLYPSQSEPYGVEVDSLTDAGGQDWVYSLVEVELNDSWHFRFIENAKLLDNAALNATNSYAGLVGTNIANQLIGSGYDNWIQGFAGNDSILGGAGNDILTGGLGDDYLDGGAAKEMNLVFYGDIDRAELRTDGRYWGTLSDISAFNLKNPTFAPTNGVGQLGVQLNLDKVATLGVVGGRAVGVAGVDTLINIQGAIGSDFNDILIGDASDNWFAGGLGNDTLVGGAGNDVMFLGANSAYGLTVNMTNAGLANLQQATAAASARTLDLSTLSTSSNSYFDLAHAPESFAGNGLGILTYWGFEAIGMSDLSDTVIGTDGNDTVLGLDGNDFIDGGAGNDVLYGNTSVTNGILATAGMSSLSDDADEIHGGSGNDQIWAGVGNGFLYGDAGNDTLNGQWGNDYLNGGAGDDVLNGGAGSDTLFGGVGKDALNGGLGDDLYIYTGVETITEKASEGIDMVFVMNTASYTLGANIENAALAPTWSIYGGSSNGASNSPTTLTGNAGDNLLLGSDADSTLIGGDGRDTLFGFGGDDVLTGGKGSDLFGLGGDQSASGSYGYDDYAMEFYGTITDFNQAESDKLLLNFTKGESRLLNPEDSSPTWVSDAYQYHYKLNIGGSETYLYGADAQTQGPEATISYDPTSGLLQLEFQQSMLDPNTNTYDWTYDSGSDVATGNANLTYFVMNGTNAAVLDANSFLLDTTIHPIHPGAQLAYPQS